MSGFKFLTNDLDDIFERSITTSGNTSNDEFVASITNTSINEKFKIQGNTQYTRYLEFDDTLSTANYGTGIKATDVKFSIANSDLANTYVKKNSMHFCVLSCASEHIHIEIQGWIRHGVVLKTKTTGRSRFLFCNNYEHSSLIIAAGSDGDNAVRYGHLSGGASGKASHTGGYSYSSGQYGGMVYNGGNGGSGQWESHIQHYPVPGTGGGTGGGNGGNSGTSSNYGFSSGGQGAPYSGGGGAAGRGDSGANQGGNGGEGGDGFYGGGGGGAGGNPGGGNNDAAGAGGGAGSSYHITGRGGDGFGSAGAYLFYDMKLTTNGRSYGIHETGGSNTQTPYRPANRWSIKYDYPGYGTEKETFSDNFKFTVGTSSSWQHN